MITLKQLEEMLLTLAVPEITVTELIAGHKTISIINEQGEYRCKNIPDRDFYLTPEQFKQKHLLADTAERYRRPKDDPNRLLSTRNVRQEHR